MRNTCDSSPTSRRTRSGSKIGEPMCRVSAPPGRSAAFADRKNSEALPFRYNDVVKGRRMDQNIDLQAGDVVVVP